MPRYYFDLVNSEIVSGERGQDLPDDITATDIAEVVAQRLSREQPDLMNRKFAIVVTGEDGERIGRVPLGGTY
jgi:hypothetical protein